MRRLRHISTLLLLPCLLCGQGFSGGGGTGIAPGGFGAGGGEDWGSVLVDWTQQMLTSFGGLFVQDGIYELAVLSAILILWTIFLWGLNKALTFEHHAHYPFPFPQVALLFLKTAILLFFLTHYMVPFPGVAFSFHSWPMAIAKHMTLQLDNGPGSAKEQLMQLLASPSSLVDKPINPFAIIDNFVYLNVIGLMGVLSFIMFVLGGLSYVLAGVFTVVGPYFIPLWLLGGRAGAWAWNWLQLMIALASYRVFASVIEYIMAGSWLMFFNSVMGGNTSIANWIAHATIVVALIFFFLVAAFSVPLLAAQVFNGAGATAQAGITALGSAARAASKFVA